MAELKKKIIRPEYDFSPTGFSELDGLIRLADKYAEQGNMEKCHELTAEIEEALAMIKNKVIKQN